MLGDSKVLLFQSFRIGRLSVRLLFSRGLHADDRVKRLTLEKSMLFCREAVRIDSPLYDRCLSIDYEVGSQEIMNYLLLLDTTNRTMICSIAKALSEE